MRFRCSRSIMPSFLFLHIFTCSSEQSFSKCPRLDGFFEENTLEFKKLFDNVWFVSLRDVSTKKSWEAGLRCVHVQRIGTSGSVAIHRRGWIPCQLHIEPRYFRLYFLQVALIGSGKLNDWDRLPRRRSFSEWQRRRLMKFLSST